MFDKDCSYRKIPDSIKEKKTTVERRFDAALFFENYRTNARFGIENAMLLIYNLYISNWRVCAKGKL